MSIFAPIPVGIDPKLYELLNTILYKAVDGTNLNPVVAQNYILLVDSGGSGEVAKVQATRDAATGNWFFTISDYP